MFGFGKKKKNRQKDMEAELVEAVEIGEYEELAADYSILKEDYIKLNEEQKSEYRGSLEDVIHQLKQQNAHLKEEYRAVSAYLTDIQLIDEMPQEAHDELVSLAKHIQSLQVDRKIYQTTESKISNERYISMQHYEPEMKDTIMSMQNDEKNLQMIMRDMKMLDAEKFGLREDAKAYAHNQVVAGHVTLVSFLLLITVFVVYILYGLIQPDKVNDTVFLALIAVSLLLIATIFAVSRKIKYNIQLTQIKLNKAIALHNKVKIKYVNATNLYEYKKVKYDVDNSYQLGRLFELYLEAKRENEKYRQTTGELNDALIKLVELLKPLELYDAQIWQSEIRALVDRREMVEVRHRLNVRRQKIRTQLEQNEKKIQEVEFDIKLYQINLDK